MEECGKSNIILSRWRNVGWRDDINSKGPHVEATREESSSNLDEPRNPETGIWILVKSVSGGDDGTQGIVPLLEWHWQGAANEGYKA